VTELSWGIVAGLAAGFGWTIITLLVRSVTDAIRPVSITTLRSIGGGALILVAALATGYGPEIMEMPLWAVLALWASMLVAMGIGDVLFFACIEYLGLTRALTLSLANPLLTLVVGIGLLGEGLTPARALGILLVVGGLALIILGKGEATLAARADRRLGLRLVFGAAAAWALSAILMKSPLQVVSPVAAAVVRIPIAGVVLSLTPWTRGTWDTLVRSPRPIRLRLGAICALSAVVSLLFTASIKYAGVAVGNVLSSTSPLFAVPFEVFVLGQRPSRETILGTIISVGGIVLMQV
jgi:drug/metabolite transporter (DMT)-like permease